MSSAPQAPHAAPHEAAPAPARPRLGISACLLGQPVRYNGGHQLDRFLRDTLGAYFEFVPVCPEVECGLGVPREAMRLVGDPAAPEQARLVTSRSGVDHTEQMKAWAAKRLDELAGENLIGFIFKSGSPSSGMERIKIYNAKGMPEKKGVGVFARAFMQRFPLVPVEDDGRLQDPGLRENFIERLFTMQRWQQMEAAHPLGHGSEKAARTALMDFHAAHKLLLLSHSAEHMRALGRLAAHASERPIQEVRAEYLALLVAALARKATPAKHTDALMHAMGFLKKLLTPDEKAELLEVIASFKRGDVPLIVPVTLLNHYVRKYDPPYLKDQVYLHPHPAELKLRNHA